MKKITLILSAALVLITLSGGAWAQSSQGTVEYQEKLKLAEQIVSLAGPADGLASLTKSMMATTRQTLTNQITQKNPQLAASQLERAIGLANEVVDSAANQFISEALPVMTKAFAYLYSQKFNVDELRSIYQYQTSDVGRKVQQFSLNVMSDFPRAALVTAQDTEAEIAKALLSVQVQLAKEGISLK